MKPSVKGTSRRASAPERPRLRVAVSASAVARFAAASAAACSPARYTEGVRTQVPSLQAHLVVAMRWSSSAGSARSTPGRRSSLQGPAVKFRILSLTVVCRTQEVHPATPQRSEREPKATATPPTGKTPGPRKKIIVHLAQERYASKRRRATLAVAAGAVDARASPSSAGADTFILDAGSGADYDARRRRLVLHHAAGSAPRWGRRPGNQAARGRKDQTALSSSARWRSFRSPRSAVVDRRRRAERDPHFRIDDVIRTFGPGATFDGTASDQIAVYGYPADGTVTVADFCPPVSPRSEIVYVGVITDASLAISGPLELRSRRHPGDRGEPTSTPR